MKTRSGRETGSKREPCTARRKISNPPLKKSKRLSLRKHFAPKTQLDDLNEDCIEEIFRHLPTVELCKFALLSKRLQGIAEGLFKRLYANKVLTFRPYDSCSNVASVKTTTLFMRIFGPFIQQLQIIGTDKPKEKRMEANMLKAISVFNGNNLRSLNLQHLDMNSKTISYLEKMLKNVPQLTIQLCHSTDKSVDIHELLLEKCRNLQTFNVIQCHWDHSTWLRRHNPTLRTVQVLRAVFKLEDIEKFFELNGNIKEAWFNVRVPKLTHRFDTDNLQRLLFISGFEDGSYCSYFLQTYTQIMVKSVILVNTMITIDKCESLAKMTDIQELRFISPISICDDAFHRLSEHLTGLRSLFLKGELFTFRMICDIIESFPHLVYLYLCKTEFDSITDKQFTQLIEARRRSATFETENYPLHIIVGRKTPVYARTIGRRFRTQQSIQVENMQTNEFDMKFCEPK